MMSYYRFYLLYHSYLNWEPKLSKRIGSEDSFGLTAYGLILLLKTTKNAA